VPDGSARRGREPAFGLLAARFGRRFSRAEAVRAQHGKGEAWHASRPPEAVVWCERTDEVAAVVAICAEHRVPVVPFGAGTSLEGQLCCVDGGVSIDLAAMNRVIEINAADLDVAVEAGVTRTQLNSDLRDLGLFFAIDPGADATLGGMAATRASGTNAVRYGTMRDNVLGVTAVMPDGHVARFGGRARKSAAGYDLTRLLVGSEGTLGVVTELRLKVHGIPEAIAAAVCGFASLEGAVTTAIETIQAGVPVARIELLDELQMRPASRSPSWRGTPRPRRSSSSSTARPPRSPSRPRPWAASPSPTAAAPSPGRRCRRSATACGRRATMCTTPRSACGRERRPSPPTSACRSPRSPTSCWRPAATSRRAV